MVTSSNRSCGLVIIARYLLLAGVPTLGADEPFVGWSEVPGNSTTATSDAAVAYQNRLYLFGVGIADHAHYVNVFDETQWAGWKLLPGGGTTNPPDAATI